MATQGFKHYSDTNVVASQHKICHLSECIQSNYLIHQSLLFIFISHIIVVKRLLDDNKNATILHFAFSNAELVNI